MTAPEKRLLAAAGITLPALAALLLARRRAAQCPWTAADAKYVRDGLREIDGLEVADREPRTGGSMFASLDRGNDR
jgi:hypothetical protein